MKAESFSAARETASARRRNNNFKIKFVLMQDKNMDVNNFKIKFVLMQGKNVDLKICGDVVRRMRVKRCEIFPVVLRNRQY